MKSAVIGASLVGASLLLVGLGHGGDDKDLRAIIDKAIKATGGADKLAKYQTMTMKGAGKFYGLGEGIPYRGEWSIQGAKQIRFAMELSLGGKDIKIVMVVNGDKGWVKAEDDVKDMQAEEVAEEKEGMYAQLVASLWPLKDKKFTLSALGEVKVEERPAVGVRVSKKGHRDVNLYFDKAKGLLVKSECMVKDIRGGGDKEMNQEFFYLDHKEAGGVRHPTKIMIKRDGKLFLDAALSDFQAHDKLEKSLFDRP